MLDVPLRRNNISDAKHTGGACSATSVANTGAKVGMSAKKANT